MFLCSLACESCSPKLGCVPTEVESGFSSKIGTIPPKSGRLDTLQGFFGGPGACSPGKNRNLKFSN